jgi:hypothetical protein
MGKVVPAHANKAYRGSRIIAPLLNLGARWKWVATFTPRPRCSLERTQLPIKYVARWAPEMAGNVGEEKNVLLLPGGGDWTVQSVAWSLNQLSYSGRN